MSCPEELPWAQNYYSNSVISSLKAQSNLLAPEYYILLQSNKAWNISVSEFHEEGDAVIYQR